LNRIRYRETITFQKISGYEPPDRDNLGRGAAVQGLGEGGEMSPGTVRIARVHSRQAGTKLICGGIDAIARIWVGNRLPGRKEEVEQVDGIADVELAIVI